MERRYSERMGPHPTPETAAAAEEFAAVLAGLRLKLADLDPIDALDGYRWVQTLGEVAVDCYVRADPLRPHFFDLISPGKQWGGDSADTFYKLSRVDPARSYRVTGRRGDAAYLSLTVYGGGADGDYMGQSIDGIVNDRDLAFGPEGEFEILLSPDPQPGDWVRLQAASSFLLTRDYLFDVRTERPTTWKVECVDAGDQRFVLDDPTSARRWRAATKWLEGQAAFQPIPYGEGNTLGVPAPPPQEGLGWSAIDASYAGGTYDLADDEALVIDGRSPNCAFWSLCLWNAMLHAYNFAYDRVTINGADVIYEADGSWRIVVSARDPGHPNWLRTQGRRRGRLWFRWFLAESVPHRPELNVVPVEAVRSFPGEAERVR